MLTEECTYWQVAGLILMLFNKCLLSKHLPLANTVSYYSMSILHSIITEPSFILSGNVPRLKQ